MSNKKQIHHRHLSHKVPQVPQQQQQHNQQYRQLCQKQIPSYSNGNLSTVYESEGSEEYDKDDLISSKIFHEYQKKFYPTLKKRLIQRNQVARPMQSPLRYHGVQHKIPYKQDQNINRIQQKYIQPSQYNESNYINNISRRRRMSSLYDNYEDCDRLQQEMYDKKTRDIKKKLQQHNYITTVLQEKDEQLKRQNYQQQIYSSTKKNVPLTLRNPIAKLSSSISKSPYVSSIGIEESPRSQRSINLIKNSLSTSINNKHNTEDDVNVYDYNENGNEEGDDDDDDRCDDEDVDYDDFENDNNENSINNVLNTLEDSLDIPSSPYPRKSEESRNHCVNYAIELTNELKSKNYENTDVKSHYKNHNFNNATDGVMTNSNTIITKTNSTNQQMKCGHHDQTVRKISEQTINSIRSNTLNNNADNNTVNNNDNNRIIHGIGEPNLHKPSTPSHRSSLIKDNLEFVMTLEKSKTIVIDLIDKQVKKLQNFKVCKTIDESIATGNDNNNDDNDCGGTTENIKSEYALDGNDNDELNDLDNEIISNLNLNLMESIQRDQQQPNQKQQHQHTIINPMSKQFRCLKSNCLRKIDLEVKQLRTLETMENGIITKTAASKRKN